ncbi:hypothetical protein QYH69_32475 [Paraburkholderia sp. SARCC-3016]|uniref:hypothetical protein n=1 Tax=Paraburkholderia sp. SARCC-3016 TaxID=3058611 RepID=UPI0028072F34|nr:hypothetical protein [Paraburkholderia sp. SARCC-3016]MDQ7981941.1 hypothetical protein [Paraburkholderia sp. SARCC-3016]
MKVKVKELAAEIELKNTGVELEIRDNDDKFLGDLIITKTSVIWCEGKTKRENGVKKNLKDFIADMNNGAAVPAKKAAAKKAAK